MTTFEIACTHGCRFLLSIGGNNLQFYPNFALFSTLGGMNLDHEFVQVSKLSEDKKKGLHQNWNTSQIQVKTKKKAFAKNGTLFLPNSSGHLRSDAHQSQIIGGDADVDHTQTIGGDTIKSLGGIYSPHPPRVSAPLLVLLYQEDKKKCIIWVR